ncbi:MAG TPA: hypothetical protein VFL17_22285, partial [Anaerolineae bacterium]|nr:hypothetical protein [Anaerolineae bacterium]
MNRRSTSPAQFLLPRLEDVVFVTLFVAVIALGPRLLNGDGDLGRHITIGGYILESRSIPTRDVFSHTMTGEPLTPHEWLSQIVFALAYRFMGLDGVVLVCALLIASTFTLLYKNSVRRSGARLVALGWVMLAVAASRLHWLARPHLFTMLFVVLWTDGLERLRQGGPSRWQHLPALMLLWVNIHGAFIAGFVIWAAYLVDYAWQRWIARRDAEGSARYGRQLVLIGAASFLASFLNPAGAELWTTSLGYVSNRYLVGHTIEYLSPDFHEVNTWPFLLMIVLSMMLLGTALVRVPTASLLLLAGWTALGLYSARNVPLYAVIAAPILAVVVGASMRTGTRLARWQGVETRVAAIQTLLRGHVWPVMTTLLLTFLLANGAKIDVTRRGNRFDPAVFPVQAVDWLEANPLPGRIFNYFTWGGYLLYRMWPEQTVFIDGQTDFYGEALTRKYEQVITLADGWQDVLRDYRVDWVLMPSDSRLARSLTV